MPLLDSTGDVSRLIEFLGREPVLNSVPLGLFTEAGDPASRAGWFVATIERGGRVVAACYRTGFPKMGLAMPGDDEAMRELARLVQRAMPDLPCIIGASGQVADFVAEWARLTGNRGTPGMPERLHRLVAVRPQPEVSGSMRRATVADRGLLVEWMRAFAIEAEVAQARDSTWSDEATDIHLARGSLFLWEDDGPASMAGGRETGGAVARIGPVYTPPSRRRRGYAGALVAGVSQLLLDAGSQACCLYTDTRNATSNHVYAEVGYEPVVDVNEVWLTAPG